MLSCRGQKVNKIIGALAHVSDSVRGRERGRVGENSAVTVIGFVLFCCFKMHRKILLIYNRKLPGPAAVTA